MRHISAVVVVAVSLLSLRPAPSEAQSKLPEIVVRASEYVDNFVQQFTNVVAEERNVQETRSPHKRRELRSDFLLVRPAGAPGWYQFRDVIEVDGKTIGGREDRLAKLFLNPSANQLDQARAISAEGDKYDLTGGGAMYQPLLAIGFLQSRYVGRFRYTVGRVDKDSGPNVRIVMFEEWSRPTILNTGSANRDFLSHGRFLIDEPTGRVVSTEFDLGRGMSPRQVVTSFRFDETLKMIVPSEMRERIGADTPVVATYSRFRRFTVNTEENIR